MVVLNWSYCYYVRTSWFKCSHKLFPFYIAVLVLCDEQQKYFRADTQLKCLYSNKKKVYKIKSLGGVTKNSLHFLDVNIVHSQIVRTHTAGFYGARVRSWVASHVETERQKV